jgi:hypothetical protein
MSTVLILLSDKRSGSTMFQEELCRHTGVQTVGYSPHTYLESHWWLMGAVLLDRPGPLYISGKPYEGYGGKRNVRTYMLDILEKCVPEFRAPTEDRALVFDGWEALCRTYAKPVFFEKSPQFVAQWAALSLMLEWIERTDFAVKVVGLVRNPHGVMYSANELFGTDPSHRQFAWLAGCRNMLSLGQMLPEGDYMRVRYEDLVADPVAGFQRIARFVGVDPDPACGSGTHAGSSEKWKNDSRYTLDLDPAVSQMARHLGYAETELRNPNATLAMSSARSGPSNGRGTGNAWLRRQRNALVKPLLLQIKRSLRQR